MSKRARDDGDVLSAAEDKTKAALQKVLKELFADKKERFALWLRDFHHEQQNTAVKYVACKCRHATLKPDDAEELCKGYGTKDGAKGNGIRKSTAWNSACKFQNRKDLLETEASGAPSTKLRASHISFLGIWQDNEDFGKRWEQYIIPSTVIKHRCGCGIPSGTMVTGCTNGKHLSAGTQAENREETVLHQLLIECGKAGPDVYQQQVAILRRVGRHLF